MLLLLTSLGPTLSAAEPNANAPITIDQAQVVLIRNTTVAASIPGRIQSVEIHEGESISAESTIARLDDSRARAELSSARAALRAATIQAENNVNTRYAERTLDVRQRELQQSTEANQRYAGSVTATEIDRLRLVIDQAALSVEQAEQERRVAEATVAEKEAVCELARLRIQEHQVTSGIAGIVAEIFVQPGQWVDAGEPVARLVSLDPIRVSGFVDGRVHDASLVGRRVRFEIEPPKQSPVTQFEFGQSSAPGTRDTDNATANAENGSVRDQDEDAFEKGIDEATPLYGVVTFVSPELHPVTSQVRLWANLENPDGRARPGMRGKLIIE